MKLPPPDPTLDRAAAGSAPSLAAGQPPAPIPSSPPRSASSATTALADQVHIHPLDPTGAMQIMMAEVRADLPLPGGGSRAPPAAPVVVLSLPGEASQTLVQLFLQALPVSDISEPAAWLTYVMEIENAVQVALERAVETTAGWRDVPSAVVAAAKETRDLVLAAITEDPPNPLWLRPEWLGLAPQMERYRRRRRRARRWLSDPDLHWREPDEDLER